jgi:hypothetical protein
VGERWERLELSSKGMEWWLREPNYGRRLLCAALVGREDTSSFGAHASGEIGRDPRCASPSIASRVVRIRHLNDVGCVDSHEALPPVRVSGRR